MGGTEMCEHTYQVNSTEYGDHILVFDGEGRFVRNVFVSEFEFRRTAYVWVLDDRFQTLFQANARQVYRWLEENPNRDRANQVGIGKDFQILSIDEFKELYG